MNHKERLLARLNAIAHRLQTTPGGVALLALGSVGREMDRMDDYSDLDFFAIVAKGTKAWFMNHLEWLDADDRLVYVFRNTIDGYKIVWSDGIYGEMAIFEPDELEHIPYSPGRLVFCDAHYTIPEVSPVALPSREQTDVSYQTNELLTNLLVGLLRERRGERLAAMMLIQRYALDRLLTILRFIKPSSVPFIDAYANERRFEQHYPELVTILPRLVPGYKENALAASTMLTFLRSLVPVEPGIVTAIETQLALIEQPNNR